MQSQKTGPSFLSILIHVLVLGEMAAAAPPVKHDQDYLGADKGPVILGVILTVSVLSTLFVAGRVYTQKKILGALHLDNWFTIVAVVGTPSCYSHLLLGS